jgi:hypothetical protein
MLANALEISSRSLESSIHNAITSFGRVIFWENDMDYLARLMVRARVTDLKDVPHFIVLIESSGF